MQAALIGRDPSTSLPAVSAAVGLARATAYRWARPAAAVPAAPSRERRPSPRALTGAERQVVLAQLHTERFVNQSPAQVFAILLDEDTYLCSPRTMYRLLTACHEVRERRAQRTHPVHAVPRLTATAPNQVWTWDVTDLRGPTKSEHYKLYVVLDLYSRYVVAWMLAPRESATLAKRLIATASQRHGIRKGQLTSHSDRGSIQIAKDLHALYEDLGIVRSLSRPRVSNDNPFSEALFKTTKYAAGYPDRFTDFAHAEQWCHAFFTHYNTAHRHSSLAYCTPAMVHGGAAPAILTKRHDTMRTAYAQHPARFVRGAPTLRALPVAVSLNPIAEEHAAVVAAQ